MMLPRTGRSFLSGSRDSDRAKFFSPVSAERSYQFSTELLWKIWLVRNLSDRWSSRTRRLLSLWNSSTSSTSLTKIMISNTIQMKKKNPQLNHTIRLIWMALLSMAARTKMMISSCYMKKMKAKVMTSCLKTVKALSKFQNNNRY